MIFKAIINILIKDFNIQIIIYDIFIDHIYFLLCYVTEWRNNAIIEWNKIVERRRWKIEREGWYIELIRR